MVKTTFSIINFCDVILISRLGRHVQEDIPALMAAAAEKYPEVAYSITRPLGKQEQILELIHNAISANE